jgi:hypothetical protein
MLGSPLFAHIKRLLMITKISSKYKNLEYQKKKFFILNAFTQFKKKN